MIAKKTFGFFYADFLSNMKVCLDSPFKASALPNYKTNKHPWKRTMNSRTYIYISSSKTIIYEEKCFIFLAFAS